MMLQEIIDKAKRYKDMYEGNNEGFNSLYRDLLELADIRASAHNSDYAKCKELLKECFDVIGTSKLCTKPIYEKLLQHFA